MTTREQRAIAQVRNLLAQGCLTTYEAQWCIDAINNRHGLTPETSAKLRDATLEIIQRAKQRTLSQKT